MTGLREAFALFVDDGAQARGLIRENVEALGAGGATRLFRRDATRLGPAGPAGRFSLVFCDPPYGRGLADQALRSALASGCPVRFTVPANDPVTTTVPSASKVTALPL